MRKIQNIHLIVGFFFLAIFLATGGYLAIIFPTAYGDEEYVRFMYRSNHIYILLASLINIALGCYIDSSNVGKAQKFGSFLVLLSPLILFLAFVVEPSGGLIDRPITFWGILALLIGIITHAGSVFLLRRRAV